MKIKNFNNVILYLLCAQNIYIYIYIYQKYVKKCPKQWVPSRPLSRLLHTALDQTAILSKQHKYGLYDHIISHALLGFWLRRTNQ